MIFWECFDCPTSMVEALHWMLLLNESFLLCTYINLNSFETCVACTRQVQATRTTTCAYSFLIQVQNPWQLVAVPGKASCLNSVAPELEIGYLPNVIQMSGIAQLITRAFTPLLFLLISFVLRLVPCHTAAGQAAFQQNIMMSGWLLGNRKTSKSECVCGSNFTINPAMQCLQSVSCSYLFVCTVQGTSVWTHQDIQRLLQGHQDFPIASEVCLL